MRKGERMTKKELSRYCWLRHEIHKQRNRLEQLRNKKPEGMVGDTVNDYRTGKGIPVKIEGVPSDEYTRPIMIGLLEEEIERNIKESEAAAEKIEQYIQTVNDPKVRELMRSRFLDCLSWEEVGKANYISPDHARKIVRNFTKQI